MTSSSNPELSIIVVNYNTKDLLKKCLDSIMANQNKLKLEITVIDNGSTDGSVEEIKKLKLKIIFNKKNLVVLIKSTSLFIGKFLPVP